MTAQIPETLRLEGAKVSLCTEPLASYFSLTGVEVMFEETCTALWRGNVGIWEILDRRLYLIDLNGKLKSGPVVSIATIFPGFPDRVFAHWYSGVLRIPKGKLLRYVHGGYSSVYERDQFITIKKGLTIVTSVVINGEAPVSDTADDGYRIHAMYTFAANNDLNGDIP